MICDYCGKEFETGIVAESDMFIANIRLAISGVEIIKSLANGPMAFCTLDHFYHAAHIKSTYSKFDCPLKINEL